MVPKERFWILILMAINLASEKMPNYYVFKRKRPRQEYIELCENKAWIGMPESGYMDAMNFNKWMSFLLNYNDKKKILLPTRRLLLFLDVLLKFGEHGIDIISL